MNRLVLTAALGAASLGLAGCDDREENMANENAAMAEDETVEAAPSGDGDGAMSNGAGTTASGNFPQGARIVDDNGVTYRVDADGTRVRLGENDSRIVIDNGVRYRVDPGGSRVRIGNDGVVVDVDTPDVDVGINDNGNLDVDVRDGDRERR